MSTVTAALIVQQCPAGDVRQNLTHSLSLAAQAVDRGACVVVFPEMNLTGYLACPKIGDISVDHPKEILEELNLFCSKNEVTLLVGMAESVFSGNIMAAHYVIRHDGNIFCYHKTHTAPNEKDCITGGSRMDVFTDQDLRFGIQLCYDAHFPELSLSMALNGADIIFIPHASPRGTSVEKLNSWLRHLTARAFDNGVFIAACNQTGENHKGLTFPGVSVFIGPDGNVIEAYTGEEENIQMIRIDLDMLEEFRSHRMRYFLPNRRDDLFGL